MIQVTNITKSYGKQALLEDVNFTVGPRERVGLVGRNGHGKTTLLKMILDEDHPDSGEIAIPRNYRIGHVSQHLKFTEPTVIAEAALGLSEHEHGETWRAEKILAGLGFSKGDLQRAPGEFSGGYQVRLNLAKILVSEPEMLLLDEPTNYLDIVSIRWLAGYLRQWKGEIILVTHDRSFMDSIITHTVGIHRRRARKIAGTTEKYYDQILKDEEIYEKTRLNDEKKRKDVEQFITRFRAKARLAGLVQSRIKALEKMEKLDKLDQIETLDFSFTYKPFPAKSVMSVADLAFSYTDEPLVRDVSISIGSHDRICVIGKNGRGKTTLLRLLSGELTPQTGTITTHSSLAPGYYAQSHTADLNAGLSIEEELMLAGCDRQRARDICGAMMFSGDMALKKISVLSGGERARVLLGKILATPANILFLDEPTNHLDMDSSDALIAAIDAFPGAVVIVTHDEMFLETLATRFIIFQESGIRVYEGSYLGFLEKIGWDEERAEAPASRPVTAAAAPVDTASKKDQRKKRADIITRRSVMLKPIEIRLAKLEADIGTAEKEMASKNEELIKLSASGGGGKIASLSKDIHRLKERVDRLFDELDAETKNFEALRDNFDRELAAIGG